MRIDDHRANQFAMKRVLGGVLGKCFRRPKASGRNREEAGDRRTNFVRAALVTKGKPLMDFVRPELYIPQFSVREQRTTSATTTARRRIREDSSKARLKLLVALHTLRRVAGAGNGDDDDG